jgi:NTE family protein
MAFEPTLREWLQAEPFTLTMSSGYFSFFAHAGFLAVLEEEDLYPRRVTGASSGAMVGSCWASGRRIAEIKAFLFNISKADFWDPAPGLGLLRGERLRQIIDRYSGVKRLEDSPIPITVSVFDLLARKTLTFSQGPFATLVYASTALPGLFQPIRVNGRLLLDGGIQDRPGLAGVAPGERVFFHHIAAHSPWRGPNSRALRIPQRSNLTTLAIDDLPRAGPDQLAVGPQIFELACQATRRALDQPVRPTHRIMAQS